MDQLRMTEGCIAVSRLGAVVSVLLSDAQWIKYYSSFDEAAGDLNKLGMSSGSVREDPTPGADIFSIYFVFQLPEDVDAARLIREGFGVYV
jgi:hypothetical protein